MESGYGAASVLACSHWPSNNGVAEATRLAVWIVTLPSQPMAMSVVTLLTEVFSNTPAHHMSQFPVLSLHTA